MKNYIHIDQFSLLYDHYLFVDAPEYYADQLFIKHQVTVRFGSEYESHDEPYVIIFCRVRKRDKERFLAALDELPNKMILCGYYGYDGFCETFIRRMERRRCLL